MGNNVSRRNFLKTSAGTGLMVAAGVKDVNFIIPKYKHNVKRPFIMTSHTNQTGHNALTEAWKILVKGGSALDAVERATNIIEVDPKDASVGYGGLPNEEGIVQLDASVMDGKTYNAGAVGCLENIKTPSSIARLVMERSKHVFMVGAGALKFAKLHGYKEENLLTEEARRNWVRWKENLNDSDNYLPPADEDKEKRTTGTVNVLAIDKNGDAAGITSTSGLSYKIPGRVGDSPIIGAGLYLLNGIGAAGVTGLGEECIKTCLSFLTVELMRMGKSPQEACMEAQQRIIRNHGGNKKLNFNEKIVAMNMNGEVGCSYLNGRSDLPPELLYYTDGEENIIYKGDSEIIR